MDNLLKMVRRIRRERIWDPSLLMLCAFWGLGIAGGVLFYFRETMPLTVTILLWILPGLMTACLVFSGFLYWKRRETPQETCVFLDHLTGAKNTLEAALESEHTNHPLKALLIRSAERDYRDFHPPLKYRIFPVLTGIHLFLAALILCAGLALLFGNRPLSGTAPKPEAPKESLKEETETQDFAELMLTLPESEIRAKPLDELEWNGRGISSHGFRALRLVLYVDGNKVQEVRPETMPEQPGEIKCSGFFSLEDLDVKPFHLVSYHMAAESRIGKNVKTIISRPQFIEVRPFREDIGVMDAAAFAKMMEKIPEEQRGDAMEQMKQLELRLEMMLQTELELNKALFAVRITRELGTEKVLKQVQKQLPGIIREQQSVADELNEYLDSESARIIPAEIVKNLENGLLLMKRALSELKGEIK